MLSTSLVSGGGEGFVTAMVEGDQPTPTTLDAIFSDYEGRRAAIIKALTTDYHEFHRQCDPVPFYKQCDPDKENVWLFAHPDGQWEVEIPGDERTLLIPEPTVGINFIRDGKQRTEWLRFIADHSGAWLFRVSYYGCKLDKAGRRKLFNRINALPAINDVVTEFAKEQIKHMSSTEERGPGFRDELIMSLTKVGLDTEEEKSVLVEEHVDDNLCGACREERDGRFHEKCMLITPAMAENTTCPSCIKKRMQQP